MGKVTTVKNEWVFASIGERVDAFNSADFRGEIDAAMEENNLLAIDLKGTAFLSLPFIKFLNSRACELLARGGQLVLVSPSEKIKRQFDIFASLDHVCVFATEAEWLARQEGIKARLRSQRRNGFQPAEA